jgi:hypothetical protein
MNRIFGLVARLFGITAMLFALLLSAVATAGAQSVTVDYGTTTGVADSRIYGTIGMAGNSAQWDAAVNLGLRSVHQAYNFDGIVPTSGSWGTTTTTIYRNAMAAGCVASSVCNTRTWNWNEANMVAMGAARSRGLNVEAELAGSNSWNADSSDPWYGFGATNASPLDWVVWGDIATKMMQHFLADQIEVFPEPDTPNEGTTRYNTYYEHAQSTIRAVSATVPIGGPGTYVDGGT